MTKILPLTIRAFYCGILPLLLLPGGCKVGPDYTPPEPEPASVWNEADGTDSDRFAQGAEIDPEWWTALGDPRLDELIRRAVEENHDIAIARQRARAARRMIGVAEAALLPHVGANASSVQLEFSENFPGLDSFFRLGQLDTRQELYSTTFDAAWELDFFGGNRRRAEAAEARAGEAEADRRGAVLTVVAEVARNYVRLQMIREQADALNRRIGVARERVDLVSEGVESEVLDHVELARARAGLKALEQRPPELRAEEAAALYRLAVLTNREPAAMFETLARTPPLPDPPDQVPVGLPGEILKRRPDLARAERELAAATAEIGVATAELYPSFSLTGSAGRQAGTFTDLFETASGTWMIVPGIRWPIFQGGRLRAELAAVEEQSEGALLAYRSAVLGAVAGVESALSRYARAFESREAAKAALRQQRNALELTEAGHRAGVLSGLDQLAARDRSLESEQRLIRPRGEVLLALITLNKELGGGWDLPGE
ncbi:MAG: efflux transporter outer membrane subunit [Puniceicoccaceae bacterium]